MLSQPIGGFLFLFVVGCCLFVLWLLFRPKPIKYLLLEQIAEGWQVLAIFYVKPRDYVGPKDETVDEFLKQFIAQKCPSNDTLWIIVDETLRFTRARFFSHDPRSYWAGIDYGNTYSGYTGGHPYSVNLEYTKQELGWDGGVDSLGLVTKSATHALQTFLASHCFWDENLYRWHLFQGPDKRRSGQKKLVASGPGPAFLQRTESGGLVGCGKSFIAQVGASVQS